MKLTLALAVVTVLALCNTGCLANRVAKDGNSIRDAVAQLYTEQAIDNLIRAHNNMPFVHLSYSGLSVTDKDSLGGAMSAGTAEFTASRGTDLTKTGLAFQLLKTSTWAGKFPVAFDGRRDRTLSFKADPVTDRNDIYEAYLEFVTNPQLFVASDSPPCGPVHMVRQSCNQWYWIPCEARDRFLQFVVTTSFATPPSAAEQLYEVGIDQVNYRYDENGKRAIGKYRLTLSRAVPNDNGAIQLVLPDGRKFWARVDPFDAPPFLAGVANQTAQPGLAPGLLSNQIYIYLSEEVLPETDVLRFVGTRGKYYSDSYPNVAPKVSGDAQKQLDLLDSIRIQLTRPNANNP